MRSTSSCRGRRARLSIAALTLMVALAACPTERVRDPGETARPAETPSYVMWEDTLGLLDTARAEEFETDPGYGDRQKLSSKIDGRLVVTGPVAAIRPVREMINLDDANFEQWRTVAVIEADSSYAPLGIRVRGAGDRNYLLLRRTGGAWEAGMIAEGFSNVVRLRISQRTEHPVGRGPVGARWLYDPDDEHIWVRCSRGCCVVDGVAAE